MLVTLALAGCGGDGDSVNPVTGAATAEETGGTTPAATISGTPATQITVGTNYSFSPSASDSDGGALTFAIKNAPSWATFSASTGQLSGSPKQTDIGTTSGIVITVTDGAATASLTSFNITVAGTTVTTTPTTGTATVSWAAPTANTNGSALTNLAGYKVYYGTDAASLTTEQVVEVANPATLNYVLTGLGSGTWYFAVASYSASGEESALSAVSSKTIS
jgi:hypothetical protein